MPIILAIETSCDETGVAVMQKEGENISVLADAIASQIDIHKETGGVIPEVAAREHSQVIRPLIEKVMREADVTKDNIDAIAITVGPGLMPALSVGVTAARTLAYAWGKPVVPVHHIEGHVYSALLNTESRMQNQELSHGDTQNSKFKIPNSDAFPVLTLIVSGGHTLLIEVKNHLQYKIIGTTKDDAVGEAFDKVARMLELPYPGGPEISRLAEEGNSAAYDFPRPMLDSGDLDFSYSGLKTSVLYQIRELGELTNQQKKDIAASFQQAIIDSLLAKVKTALEKSTYQTLLLSGGVAANEALRTALEQLAQEQSITLNISPVELCGDNAVMIGQVGLQALEAGRTKKWPSIDAIARVSIEEFSVSN